MILRQVMGGLPGASKIPILGTLFRSRDFVRNETELVIIATPYLVRPVARNKLARPDDNLNPSSDGAAYFLSRVNRIYGKAQTDLPNGRYHGVVGLYLQVRVWSQIMTYKDTVAMRNKASGLQTGKTWLKPVIAVLLTGTLLGGCANVHNIEVGSVPDDYRTNHPIVISEKAGGGRHPGCRHGPPDDLRDDEHCSGASVSNTAPTLRGR